MSRQMLLWRSLGLQSSSRSTRFLSTRSMVRPHLSVPHHHYTLRSTPGLSSRMLPSEIKFQVYPFSTSGWVHRLPHQRGFASSAGDPKNEESKNDEESTKVEGEGGGFWSTFKRTMSAELEKNKEIQEGLQGFREATRFRSESSGEEEKEEPSEKSPKSSSSSKKEDGSESQEKEDSESLSGTQQALQSAKERLAAFSARTTEWTGSMKEAFGRVGEQMGEGTNKLTQPVSDGWVKLREKVEGLRGKLDQVRDQVDQAVKPVGDRALSEQQRLSEEAKKKVGHVRGQVKDVGGQVVSQVASQVSEVARPAADLLGDTASKIRDSTVVKKVQVTTKKFRRNVLGAEEERASPYMGPEAGPSGPKEHRDALAVRQESLWRRQIEELREKAYGSQVYRRISDAKTAVIESDNPYVQRGLDVADNVVARASDLGEQMWGETEQAAVMRELKTLIPGFDLYTFLEELESERIPKFLMAEAHNDMTTLQEMSTEAMYNKAEYMSKQLKDKGLTTKLRILDLADVNLVKALFDNDNPVLILTFVVQENREISDKTGEVVEGKNAVTQVHYVWLMTYHEERGWMVADQSVSISQAVW